MRVLKDLFDNNRSWAEQMQAQHPQFFLELSRQQSPRYLWIGCADSRVPANQIVGLLPGELFVHRNVANLVIQTDFNCLSVMQYAIEVLKVKHVIVCGHYGCGGVRAALENTRLGLIDNWLRPIQRVADRHAATLDAISDHAACVDKLCELNVIEQVVNVCQTTIVQDAWARDQELSVHGWIYSLADGLLRDLDVCVTCPDEMRATYAEARQAISR